MDEYQSSPAFFQLNGSKLHHKDVNTELAGVEIESDGFHDLLSKEIPFFSFCCM
ncbi:hypothetical protein TIFTF001_012006 [Ficus carica]|uniref:Uncharacterized protein n=1 Tax=Ficus carica TaxID=3494 RepID=A0AA88D4V3_FICCA|nr:hypothetical protein TIFTF001_012006 [Ficus carica]